MGKEIEFLILQQILKERVRKMQFSIIKVCDGLFVSNTLVMEDYDFLFNNKVSHLIGWAPRDPQIDSIEQELGLLGVKLILLDNCAAEAPGPDQLIESTNAILSSREQYLCCLLFADHIADVLPLLVAYLQTRYRWDRCSALGFLEKKLELQNISGLSQKMDRLRDFDEGLEAFEASKGRLIKVEWNCSFLKTYASQDAEELVIINTVKNSLPAPREEERLHPQRGKNRQKKVQWTDLATRNSINAGKRLFLNTRISSSLKKSISNTVHPPVSSQKPVLKPYLNMECAPVSSNGQKDRVWSAKKSSREQKFAGHRQRETEDLEYLSLKDFTRTNLEKLRGKASKKLHRNQSQVLKIQQRQYASPFKDNGNILPKDKNPRLPEGFTSKIFNRSWKNLENLPNRRY